MYYPNAKNNNLIIDLINKTLREIISKVYEARITKSGRKIIKSTYYNMKITAVNYPTTGTTVWTIVSK